MVYLSKSKYCGLWQCPKIAWLRKYKPEASRLDGSVLARMEAGNEVAALARSLYGDFGAHDRQHRRKSGISKK